MHKGRCDGGNGNPGDFFIEHVVENPQDIRKKKLLPTQKLLDESSNFLERAEQMETKICNVLDRTEREELWKLERKLLLHLAGKEQNKERQEVTLQ